MGHAGIFINIIALIIGVLAVFYSYQTHKTCKYPFLHFNSLQVKYNYS